MGAPKPSGGLIRQLLRPAVPAVDSLWFRRGESKFRPSVYVVNDSNRYGVAVALGPNFKNKPGQPFFIPRQPQMGIHSLRGFHLLYKSATPATPTPEAA